MAESFRIEKDSLGEMQVPADALYAAQTQQAVLNFPVSGLKPYPAFVWSQTILKRAAAEVNRDLGLLEPRLADAIIQAADATRAEHEPEPPPGEAVPDSAPVPGSAPVDD